MSLSEINNDNLMSNSMSDRWVEKIQKEKMLTMVTMVTKSNFIIP